ncbi:hypothetical protein RCO28_32515 [Streptomyces sp. LHD-70]|uniref:hypothetical protein n=1 Tax=Streptomyces sp. LHD-70 TaxID=3072140 RepID=UPI00280D8B73|nr:hypothetical protein [Streptomyces sp. LHD-70]MDQ8707156.1 hypothetical protein [Streptomyces sp. LHD-70]
MIVFVSGCTDGTDDTDGKGRSSSSAKETPSPVSFPSSPPDSAKCPGKVLDHRDIKHPNLGPVRVFLVRRSGSQMPSGCIAAVTGRGHVLEPIGVDVYENELRFADPASDTTRNTFVLYNPGRYDGVLVLVPDKDGFEDVDWAGPEEHYSGGRLAYYYARLSGPGEDGRYAIVKSENSCDPTCAEGTTSNVTLHWNGHAYVPAA